MNIPKQAVEKAIEGGWRGVTTWNDNPNYDIFVQDELIGSRLPSGHTDTKNWTEVALDPTFWQALGKALGWDEDPYRDPIGTVWEKTDHKGNSVRYLDDWNNAALCFYDLILAGGDTEKFWEEILK